MLSLLEILLKKWGKKGCAIFFSGRAFRIRFALSENNLSP